MANPSLRNRNIPAPFVETNQAAENVLQQNLSQPDTAGLPVTSARNIEGKGKQPIEIPQLPPAAAMMPESTSGAEQMPEQMQPPAADNSMTRVPVFGGDAVTNDPAAGASNIAAMRGGMLSPYFQKIRANQQQMEVLKTMPVTDSDGRTTSGIKSVLQQDSRFASGAKAFFANIRKNPYMGAIRSWGDLARQLAGAGGAAVGGAINKTWNEEEKRMRLLAELQGENERLSGYAKQEQAAIYQQAQMQNLTEDNRRQAEESKVRAEDRSRSLDLRESRNNFLQTGSEQKIALAPILKRGYYKEGSDAKEDANLEKLGIVLADFDSRKPITKEQAGKFFQWNHDKNDWMPVASLPVDESEVPVEFSINGKRLKLRPRDIASFESASLLQGERLKFAKQEGDDNRELRKQQLDILRQNAQFARDKYLEAQKKGGLTATEITTIQRLKEAFLKDKNRGRLSEEDYNLLVSDLPDIPDQTPK